MSAPIQLALYSFASVVRVSVLRGDGFNCPADACVFGRAPAFRRRVVEVASKDFTEVDHLAVTPPAQLVSSEALPWTHSVSFPYRGRSGRVPNEWRPGSHIGHVIWSFSHLLRWSTRELGARTVTLLPISWRNPDLVVCAMLASVWVQAGDLLWWGEREPSKEEVLEFRLIDRHEPERFVTWLDSERERLALAVHLGGFASAKHLEKVPLTRLK